MADNGLPLEYSDEFLILVALLWLLFIDSLCTKSKSEDRVEDVLMKSRVRKI
jgi:hypothetical protein